MKTIYNLLSLTLATIILSSCASQNNGAKAQEVAPQIELTQSSVTSLDANTVKLVMQAKGKGVAVGAFFIYFYDTPPQAKLEGYYEKYGRTYVNGGTANTPSTLLLDNGKQDEDPRTGVFAYTFHTKDWPTGWYTMRVAATNRPAPGDWLAASRDFRIKVGDAPPLQTSNIPSAVNKIIYMKEGVYPPFPSLYVFPNGDLATSFSTRTHRSHKDNSGGSVSFISKDNGKTWTKNSAPLIYQKWRTKDGRLVRPGVQGWVHVDASQEEKLKKEHKVIMKVRPGTIAYLGGAYFETSTDNGKTWVRKEISMPSNIVGLMLYSQRPSTLNTSKGVRLYAVYGLRSGTSKREVYFLRSDDDGKSWKCYPMYPDGLSDSAVGLTETAIEEAADGTIVAMMRSDPSGYLWEATSADGGLTWTKPAKTSIWGFPADLIRLKDGRLLCAYGYRRSPMGIRAVISRDNGKTWDIKQELIIRADGLGLEMDLGYPLLHQLPDGSIFCIYYITTDGYHNTQVDCTTFKLPQQ